MMSPRWAALPISETRSGPKYSGKIVMISMRTRPLPAPLSAANDRRTAARSRAGDGSTRNRPGQTASSGSSRPGGGSGAGDDQQVLSMMADIGDRAHRLAGHGDHVKPDQLVIVELIRIGRYLDL